MGRADDGKVREADRSYPAPTNDSGGERAVPVEFVEFEVGRQRAGLRMVVVPSVPSPWGEAAKGALHYAGMWPGCSRIGTHRVETRHVLRGRDQERGGARGERGRPRRITTTL